MTSIFSAQRIAPVGGFLGLFFAMLSFDYFEDYMARAAVLAACGLLGAITGAAIGHSIPRAK